MMRNTLFNEMSSCWQPQLPDATIRYYPHFLSLEEANHLYTFLERHVPWQQDPITVYGKTHWQPRLTALYGNNGQAYSYSGITMQPHTMLPELTAVQEQIEEVSKTVFTTVLLNWYRHGQDSNGWHADDEKELGKNPVIASLSLGAPRFFHLKHRTQKEARLKMQLEPGSLLLMEGTTQEHWLHQIPKTRKQVGGRINLTFRKISCELFK